MSGLLVGRPQMGLRKPKETRLGADFAGVVEAVGAEPHGLRAGRRGLRREDGRFRRVRLRQERDRAEAGERRRSSRRRPCRSRRSPRSRGFATRAARAGAEGPDQRRLGRGGHVRRADRQGVRGGGDRACAARGTSSARARSAPTTSSTTRSEDFTRSDERYDLLLDVAGSRSWSRVQARAEARREVRPHRVA